jgi:hypothetical protein
MGQIYSSVTVLIEDFLTCALRLEGASDVDVGLSIRVQISRYEEIFRDAQSEMRDKDLSARVCRAFCRGRVTKEMMRCRGTPTEVYLQRVLGAIPKPGFSSSDR